MPAEELQAIVRIAPEFSDMFMTLYRDYLRREEQHREKLIRSANEPATGFASRFPYDEVRDWVQAHHNYFDTLDRIAEQVFEDHNFNSATLRDDLTRYLLDEHGITIGGDAQLLGQGTFWRLNKTARRLMLAEDSSVESKIFWVAHVIGQLDQKHRIDREVRRAEFSTDEAQKLARIALANYFAGALMMPYRRFCAYAQLVRYDVQRLQYYFGASFEQVCHRLSTMQRTDMRGIPFYFAKTDIAGNILKRSSATAFQFAQFGGPCPVWNVYRAFAHPNEILVQMAITPDQTRYLNIARTVGRSGGSYLSRPRSVAVVLGCEISHAAETVYAAGLDLNNPDAADPIGPGLPRLRANQLPAPLRPADRARPGCGNGRTRCGALPSGARLGFCAANRGEHFLHPCRRAVLMAPNGAHHGQEIGARLYQRRAVTGGNTTNGDARDFHHLGPPFQHLQLRHFRGLLGGGGIKCTESHIIGAILPRLHGQMTGPVTSHTQRQILEDFPGRRRLGIGLPDMGAVTP